MRIPPIAPADLSPEQKPLFEDMKQGIEAKFTGFVSMREDGALVGPWAPTLRFPKFGKPWWDYIKALADNPVLPKPVREVAILVTGARFKSRYELYAHIAVSEKVGLTDAKIGTIVAGQRPADLTKEEAVAYDMASALVSGGPVPHPTYDAAVAAFGVDGAAELVYLVAGYCMVSAILNGFAVPVPDDAD
ncbi:MAG: carboxymuconolactone decarboxylase family protein [Methylobacteriaceae bacterium]|nr:carboxymuconolactone decarboxylase family protein [Methylobacteriaceae bacterium]